MTLTIWLGIVLCLSQSAILSGLNLGLFSLGKLELEVAAKKGDQRARRIQGLRIYQVLLYPVALAGAVETAAANTDASVKGAETTWQTLAPGLDLAVIEASRPSIVGDSRMTVVRIDPAQWELVVVGTSLTGATSGRTAREWARSHQLAVAINAGMFGADHRTHVGYLRVGDHVHSSHVNAYQSVAAFGLRPDADGPPFRIFDLDEPGVSIQNINAAYATVIQNLRLIKHPGQNRWSQQDKIWSEAALAQDHAGRILFIFCRSPYSMHDLNIELLDAGIGLVAAQHLEGGPEAQLYLKVGDVEIEQFGSYETGFLEHDANASPWPVPLVLGARPLL